MTRNEFRLIQSLELVLEQDKKDLLLTEEQEKIIRERIQEVKAVSKESIYHTLTRAIIYLGKNDPEECRECIRKAEYLLDQWLKQRPEKARAEQRNGAVPVSREKVGQ